MITNKLSGIFIVAAAGLLLAATTADAGVVGSKHDFTAANGTVGNPGGTGQGNTTATTQVCVFCHTPHGAQTDAAVPLWNKVLTTATYTRYSSILAPSFTSQEAPVGSVSIACLSCHDGTQAMDVVLNLPGSGLYDAGGVAIDGGIGVMTGSPVPMLGTDLSNDHPISMQYGGGGVSVTTHTTDNQFTGTLGDPDFVKPFKATVNTSQPVWWVDSPVGGPGTREKTDMLLYARTNADTGVGDTQPFVECGSCHDPHNDQTEGTSSVQFLRIENTASQICTACHIK
jgi:hypothetical protein